MKELQSNIRIKLEKGNIYFFFVIGLISSGKSTFFNLIISKASTEKNKEKYNIKTISSDQIRSDICKKYMEEHQNISLYICIEKTNKKANTVFNRQIYRAIDKADKEKINIILIDKNIQKGIDLYLKKYLKDKSRQYFVVFIPKINNPINLPNLKFPLSVNYFIQCYIRLKNRQDHLTINGEDEKSRQLFTFFFKSYQNFDFYENIKGKYEYDKIYASTGYQGFLKRQMQKKNNYDGNIFLHEINFTDESKYIKIDKKIEEFLVNVVGNFNGQNNNELTYYKEKIDNFYDYLEEKYDGKNIFQNNKEIIIKEVEDLLENGILDIEK